MRISIRNFDTYGSFSGNGGDDTNAEGGEAQGDIVFEIFYFGYFYTRFGNDFIQCNGGPYSSFDGADAYAVIFERVDDTLFVCLLLIDVDRIIAGLVFSQQVECRCLVVRKVESRVIFIEFVLLFCLIFFYSLFDNEIGFMILFIIVGIIVFVDVNKLIRFFGSKIGRFVFDFFGIYFCLIDKIFI